MTTQMTIVAIDFNLSEVACWRLLDFIRHILISPRTWGWFSTYHHGLICTSDS